MDSPEPRPHPPVPADPALAALAEQISGCRACPRLVAWREQVGEEKRAAFRDELYWARPVPGFGDPAARVCIVGLAPAAHGANRTGRMFTGDRSGDFLYAALWRTGFANQPRSVAADDGLELRDAWVTAPVRCAPPANRPTGDERRRCHPFLERELALLGQVQVFVPLGQVGHNAVCDIFGLRPRPRFAHGAVAELPDGRHLVSSFHVSQQNTFTGRLTEAMFDDVLTHARVLAGLPPHPVPPTVSPAESPLAPSAADPRDVDLH